MNPYEITEALEKGRNALANPKTNEPYSYLTITRDITTRCCSISETAKLWWAAHASNKSSSIRFLEELQSGGAAQVVREGCEDLYRLTRCFVRAPLDC